MIFVSICVGASCHLKGSETLAELFQNKISEEKPDDRIVRSGRFCLGMCNRIGVTVSVGDVSRKCMKNPEKIPSHTSIRINFSCLLV